MGIKYDALLKGIKAAEQDNHIIVDRKSNKVQEVSLKRFLLFSNVLEAANIKLNHVKAGILTKADLENKNKKADVEKLIEGEKKLALLRKVNDIYAKWENSIAGRKKNENIKDLEREIKQLDQTISKLSAFKTSVDSKVRESCFFEKLSNIDENEIQKLNDSINALKLRKEILEINAAYKKGTLSVLQAEEEILKKLDKYQSLHQEVIKQSELISKAIPQDELVKKTIDNVKDINKQLSLSSFVKENQLKDIQSLISVNIDTLSKLEKTKRSDNIEALDIYKSLLFLKELEIRLFQSDSLESSHLKKLVSFPFVSAFEFYQKGEPLKAGEEIFRYFELMSDKIPSQADFDDVAKEIFGERLDPIIYGALVKEFNETKIAAQCNLIWFEFVSEKGVIPTWEQFKQAFEEKVGILPLKENYDRLIQNLKNKNEMNAQNVWKSLHSKNKSPPTWNDFEIFFKKSVGIEPEKTLYLDLVKNEIQAKENRLIDILNELKRLAQYVKPRETWYAKENIYVQDKLKDLNTEIDAINRKLIDLADILDENEKEKIKKQLEHAILARESITKFLNNPDRIRLLQEAQELNLQLELLKNRL